MDSSINDEIKKHSEQVLHYIDESPSPWHAVSNAKKLLAENGFKEIFETQTWNLEKGGKYYFSRNNSTLFGFTVGQKFDANSTGFKIVGAHTDSPCLRLAPVSKMTKFNYNQACIQTYGGGLWYTWLDRDLTLAGRVITKDGNKLVERLVNLRKPVCSIPNLCIHLRDAEARTKIEANPEEHLRPIFSSQVYSQLTGEKADESAKSEKHYGKLLALIAEELSIKVEEIVDMELCFADCQKSSFVGVNGEFLAAPRLDNLFSSYAALQAIINQAGDLSKTGYVDVVCLFDHEEIGSKSAQGADSPILAKTMERIFNVLTAENKDLKSDAYDVAIRRSFCVSADQAHAIHPNYPQKHQENHRVEINKGVVIKVNANQRYATESRGLSIFKEVGLKASVPIQEIIVR